MFVERGFAVIYVFFFNVDPPLKQSSQGEPTGKGVTEAAVWDAWVRGFLNFVFLHLFFVFSGQIKKCGESVNRMFGWLKFRTIM